MKRIEAVIIALVLPFAFSLSGCATAPVADNSGAIAADFSDSSLEVLFATEFPVASKDEALAKAAKAYRDAEYDKAQFYLVRALSFDLTDVGVLLQIGNLHVLQGNGALAARAFTFALQQDAEHPESLEGLGLLHFRAGNDEQAKALLETAVAAKPGLWRAHNALGVISDRNQDYENAHVHYDLALAIQPESDSVLINRGYSKYLSKDYREAALDFYAVATRSGNAKAWRNLGLVYARQGWYTSALETFLETVDAPEAHNEVGAIALENGDTDVALRFLEEAIRLSPTYYASAEKNLAQVRQAYRSR